MVWRSIRALSLLLRGATVLCGLLEAPRAARAPRTLELVDRCTAPPWHVADPPVHRAERVDLLEPMVADGARHRQRSCRGRGTRQVGRGQALQLILQLSPTVLTVRPSQLKTQI